MGFSKMWRWHFHADKPRINKREDFRIGKAGCE